MKTAFLFPGQGAQSVGMGLDFAQAFPIAADVFERANQVVGYDLKKICFEGPADKLDSTVISQPAIFVTSAAILEVLRTESKTACFKPDVIAGLSLGEYTALYAAGVINFDDALMLVRKRGQAMQDAADSTSGSMVSIIGLDDDKVMQLCAEAAQGQLLVPVNFNCPGQIVISGDKQACARAEKLAANFGALKAVPLAVAGAFHTAMMDTAAKKLADALENCTIEAPKDTQIIANINVQYYRSPEQIKNGLIKQLTSPILWQKCMERLIADGITSFYEIGPGRVLTGLMKRINRKAKIINISSTQALSEAVF
jgi:[acyl-carrier-protein] S-malonyltransferase